MPHLFTSAILSLVLSLSLACSGSQPEMQTFTWDSGTPAGAVSFEAPVGWEWNPEYIERAKSRNVNATGIRTPEGTEGYANAIVALWEGPVDEWVETLE